MTWQGNFMCRLTLFSLSLIAVICRAIIGKTSWSEKAKILFKSSYLPIDDDWRIVGDGVPDILFCGSEQKKHFVIRLFLSFGFIFNILQNRFSLQPLLICYLQKCSFKPAKILDCIFCEASFETASGRTIHLNMCKLKPSPVADSGCRELVKV